jgi:hypothetical protein
MSFQEIERPTIDSSLNGRHGVDRQAVRAQVWVPFPTPAAAGAGCGKS